MFDLNESANLTKGELLLVIARVYARCEKVHTSIVDGEGPEVSDEWLEGYNAAQLEMVGAVAFATGEGELLTEEHHFHIWDAIEVASAERSLEEDRAAYAHELSSERQVEHAAWQDLFAKLRELKIK